jgi:phosphotransacetylase
MKGMLHTRELMRAVLRGLRTQKRVSHCFVVELPSYHKLLFVTDAAVNIAPDLEAKAAIVQNAIDLAHLLGVERPKVAVLSAVETINPAVGSTIDAACLSKMAERGQIEGAEVEGPLAFDNAICRAAWVTRSKVHAKVTWTSSTPTRRVSCGRPGRGTTPEGKGPPMDLSSRPPSPRPPAECRSGQPCR